MRPSPLAVPAAVATRPTIPSAREARERRRRLESSGNASSGGGGGGGGLSWSQRVSSAVASRDDDDLCSLNSVASASSLSPRASGPGSVRVVRGGGSGGGGSAGRVRGGGEGRRRKKGAPKKGPPEASPPPRVPAAAPPPQEPSQRQGEEAPSPPRGALDGEPQEDAAADGDADDGGDDDDRSVCVLPAISALSSSSNGAAPAPLGQSLDGLGLGAGPEGGKRNRKGMDHRKQPPPQPTIADAAYDFESPHPSASAWDSLQTGSWKAGR